MAKHTIAWLPGDGIGTEVLQAASIVLDAAGLDAEFLPGDIGWEFWCQEGDAFPQRTIDLLKRVDAAMFGAITSKPAESCRSGALACTSGQRAHLPLAHRAHETAFRSLCLFASL